jgi:MFS superfamily sulfate permease-like transporter
VLVLDLSRVHDLEYSALKALMETENRGTERGAVIWFAGLNPGVLKVVRHAGLDERLGRERLLFNAREAIERFRTLPAPGKETPMGAPAPAMP